MPTCHVSERTPNYGPGYTLTPSDAMPCVAAKSIGRCDQSIWALHMRSLGDGCMNESMITVLVPQSIAPRLFESFIEEPPLAVKTV